MESFILTIFYLAIGFILTCVSIGLFGIHFENNFNDNFLFMFCVVMWPLVILMAIVTIIGKFLVEIGKSLSSKT